MLRKLLLLLALLVLIAIGLVYTGIISWGGGSTVEVRPVDVSLEERNVNLQVPVPVIEPGGRTAPVPGTMPPSQTPPAPPQAQPAPIQPAPAQPAPAQPAPAPQP